MGTKGVVLASSLANHSTAPTALGMRLRSSHTITKLAWWVETGRSLKYFFPLCSHVKGEGR